MDQVRVEEIRKVLDFHSSPLHPEEASIYSDVEIMFYGKIVKYIKSE